MIKVALLGSFPIFPYRDRVAFWNSRPDLTTTWNYNLAKALARTGRCEVHVLTNAPLLRTRTLLIDGFTVHFVGHLPKLNWWDYVTRFRYSKWHLHRILRRLRPDIVHGSGTDHEYAYVATTFPRPSIFTVHGVMRQVVATLRRPSWSFDALLARYEARVARRARFMIAVNDYARRQVPAFRGTIFNVPNAVADEFFTAEPRGTFEIVFVGGLIPIKRVGNLIRAAAQLVTKYPELSVGVVGGAAERGYAAQVRTLVTTLGLRRCVQFLGRREQSEVARLMAGAKLVVLPSATETAPMVCAEAQACGTPVVASRAGGIPEVVLDGETGLLVEPDDVDGLASALDRLLGDPAARARMGGNARKRARDLFHPSEVAEATLAAYESVLSAWSR